MADKAGTLPWVEKYRPQTLNDLISHEDIISTLNKLIDENQLPHLLFYGPPGTGKTSTMLACARKMFGNNMQSMTLELNASDDRGINVVKEQIKEFASTKKIFSSGVKLIILDEADAMTSPAQAALRRVIEKFTKNTRFCLICNYVSKITPALQSRCMKFRFSPLPLDKIDSMIQRVVEKENVQITDDGRRAITRLSKGDMRLCLNIMQSTVMAFGDISEKTAYLCTGNPLPSDMRNITFQLLNSDFTTAYNFVKELQVNKGIALQDIIQEIHDFILSVKELSPRHRAYLLDQISGIENRLSLGTNESIQLSCLVSICQIVRSEILPK